VDGLYHKGNSSAHNYCNINTDYSVQLIHYSISNTFSQPHSNEVNIYVIIRLSVTKRYDEVVGIPALHFGGLGFESWPQDWIP
jgi:hypothetical protein